MKKELILVSAALLLALAGCGQSAESTPAPAETASQPAAETVMPTPAPATPAPVETAAPSEAVPSPADTPALEATPAPTESAAQPKPTQTPDPVPTEEPLPTPEVQPTQDPAVATVEPAPEPERPTDAEVLSVYREAAEAYSWFAGYNDSGLALDLTDGLTLPLPTGGEGTFFRVTRPGLGSTEELRGYLKTLFSDEVVDGLLKDGSAAFADGPEGGLYTTGAGRGSNITKGGVTLEVIWPQEGEPVLCTVQATVELLDLETLSTVTGTQVYQFPYQKVGDKWVFTQFESIF